MLNSEQIKELVLSLSLDEKVGQLLNYDYTHPPFPREDFEKVCKETVPGSLFFNNGASSSEEEAAKNLVNEEKANREIIETVKKYAKIPPIITTDGGCFGLLPSLPFMAWGAVNDPILTKRYAKEAARTMRSAHNHVLLEPVLDINYNPDSPIANIQSFSDDPDHVIKIAGAYVEGTVEGGMVTCCKHFPGDGCDSRNQHFCTTVNSKGKQEWLDTYGRVYKEMFNRGCMAVMCAHICLPSWQTDNEKTATGEYLPCSLSHDLMSGLLKGELGFKGCIISDAMSMIGAVAVCPREKLGVSFIKAGGDLMLFAHPEDHKYIKDAVLSGEISEDRLNDAVTRVLIMKNSVGLLDDTPITVEKEYTQTELLTAAAKKTAHLVRNIDGVFPVDLKKGDRVLLVIQQPERTCIINEHKFDPLVDELEKRGYVVTVKQTPFMHTDLANVCEDFDCVLVVSAVSAYYSNGGSLRLGSDCTGPYWDGFGLKHPKFIYASFGSPYILFEAPFLHTYLNCYSCDDLSQRAFVDVLTGKAPALGESPVEFKGFFERTV